MGRSISGTAAAVEQPSDVGGTKTGALILIFCGAKEGHSGYDIDDISTRSALGGVRTRIEYSYGTVLRAHSAVSAEARWEALMLPTGWPWTS